MDSNGKRSRIYLALFIMANRLQVLGDSFDKNITLKQWLMISTVKKAEGHGLLSLSDIAEILGNSRQNIKKMALILERQGYIQLSKDPSDDRKMCVSLTPKCNEYYGKRLSADIEFISQLFDGMNDGEVETLFGLLKRMAQNVGTMEEEYANK